MEWICFCCSRFDVKDMKCLQQIGLLDYKGTMVCKYKLLVNHTKSYQITWHAVRITIKVVLKARDIRKNWRLKIFKIYKMISNSYSMKCASSETFCCPGNPFCFEKLRIQITMFSHTEEVVMTTTAAIEKIECIEDITNIFVPWVSLIV